jgi:hypothetical protein
MDDIECERKNKWIGGCKFEARYDITPPTKIPYEIAASFDPAQGIRALSKQSYVCDVCTRCGKTTTSTAAIASREAGKEE